MTIIIFLVVGIQLVFSTDKVSGLVRSSISEFEIEGFEKEDIKIEFEKAQVTVLGSFSYPFGIRIKKLNVELKKDCKKYHGAFETVVLPLHLMKAMDKEIELGLIRLSSGDFKVSNECDSTKIAKKSDKKALKKSSEKKIIKVIEKISKFDLSIVKNSSDELRFLGILIYDVGFQIDEGKEFVVDRFKALLGTGELVAGGEWSSKLVFPEGITDITGNFKVSEKAVTAEVRLKEKEGRLGVNGHISRGELAEQQDLAQFEVVIKDFPLSIASRFKEFNLAGMNLRKTWLDLDAGVKIFQEKIFFNINSFKTHGDFGDLELGGDGFQALWTRGGEWVQPRKAEVKLSEISLEKIIAINPKKKARGVFSEFGKFNAFLSFENLNSLSGDFETKDFSILFRSMGKAAYQKAKYARGKLGYILDEKLFFILDEVDLIDGDFEGFIRLDYSYADKALNTKFDMPHFKLNPKISEGLFKMKIEEDLKIYGEGQVKKSVFVDSESDQEAISSGNLQFMLKTSKVDFKHWDLSNVSVNCGLDESELKCKVGADSLQFSDSLLKESGAFKKKYGRVDSEEFSYKDEKLLFNLKSSDSKLLFDWTREEGLSLYPNGYGGRAVKTRQLD